MDNHTPRSTKIIDPIADTAWNEFVESHPEGSIFHHSAWLALLRDQYRYRVFAICVEQSGRILSGIPFCEVKDIFNRKKMVCLPFSDCCGPLGSSPEDLRILLDQACSMGIESGAAVELRASLEGVIGFKSEITHWLHVTSIVEEPDTLWRSFRPRVQRAIKKAQKSSLTSAVRRDPDAMEIFYRLHLKTRRKQGIPIQPRRYFSLFQKHIIERNLGFIHVVYDGTRALSAGVFCEFKDTIVYKYGASDPACLDLSPNYLMLWDAMCYARERGRANFDFGKTEMANQGLRLFKNGWNPVESKLAYSYFPKIPSREIFEAVNENLVRPCIRHSPELVCRLAGELLYKYVAAQ